MIARIKEWWPTFADPRPKPEVMAEIRDARSEALNESRDAIRGIRETQKRIDSMYDRVVMSDPREVQSHDQH